MAPPKLSLRQKRMKSRLNEVEKNFINSTTDADFARNSKLLQSLRTKAKEMGLPTKTDKQLIESIDTNRKDKLKRGKIAGYQEGVYNPKTKKVEYTSAVDDPNRYDIVSFADDLSTIGLGLTGAGLAYKIAKNPKLITQLPKNVQAGVRAAYNKLKGNKTMAPPKSPKKAVVNLTLSAVSKALGSKLSKPSFDYLKGLPKIQRDALLPKVNSGSLNTLKKIKDAAGNLDNSKLISNVSKTQTKATKALNKSKTKPSPKTSKTDGRSDIQTRAKSSERTSTRTRSVEGEPVNLGANRGKGGKFAPKSPTKDDNTVRNLLTLGIIGGTGAAVDDSLRKKEDAKTDSETVSDKRKKETQLGVKKTRKPTGEMNTSTKKSKKDEIGTEDPSSAPTKKKTKISDSGGREDAKAKNKTPKRKPLEQGKRKIKTDFGTITVDSTDKGMSKFSGFDNREELEAEEEMNFRKGGMPKYKKGGMAKAFGKGGMYKGNKKTYGMRYGGFTRRGMGK